jgi:hypothetical protein
MNQLFKKIFSITALLSFVAVEANSVTPTVVFRSQGFHGDRQRNVGEVGHINLYDMESWNGTFDLGIGYMRSFRGNRIAHCLFGDSVTCPTATATSASSCDTGCSTGCDGSTILVQGSSVTSRDANAWLADYFYLNCSYDGSFSVKPLIQNVVVDLDFYLGLDEWVNGMYFRIYGPINWTKWQTRFCVNDPATVLTTSCSAGYFTPSGSIVELSSLADYFAGQAPATVDNVTFQGLKWGKMGSCEETQTGFADLRAELGWNFLHDEDYHLGVGLHVAAPTGNKVRADYVLQPVVGNGKHWELGGTAHGHYVFWRSEDEEKHFGFYVDAVITHLFNANEQRTFDLNNKDNSRYMLASKFTKQVTNDLAGRTTAGTSTTGSTAATSQFALVYAPVANLTTTDYKVSVGVQADITAMFNFTSRGLSWDVGYNFWGRSCESIKCPSECDPCNTDNLFLTANANTWALKGDARMFGFAGATDGGTGLLVNTGVALSASESGATILAGTNATAVNTSLTNVAKQNGGVDNPQFAIAGTDAVRLIHTPTTLGGGNVNANQIQTSIQPVFLKNTDVALQETKGLSNTVFTNLSYTWDRDNWIPYLGIGGSAEFGRNSGSSSSDSSCGSTTCSTSCDDCLNCALSQWSIWVKGGISFD